MNLESEHRGPDQLQTAISTTTWLADEAVKLRADDKDLISNPPISMVTAFKAMVEKYPDKLAIVDRSSGVENVYTYRRYYDSVVQVAKAFIKLGLENSRGVGINGHNSSQWIISYIAGIFAGGYVGGIDPASQIQTTDSLTHRAKCNIIVTDDEADSYLKLAEPLPLLKAVIQYRGRSKRGLENVYTWDEIRGMNVDDLDEELQRRIMNMAPNKCCTIISTSGTTGQQKWVMISHDHIISTTRYLLNFLYEGQKYCPEIIFSYQPLRHFSSMLSDIFWPLLNHGCTVYIVYNIQDQNWNEVISLVKEVRPTLFLTTATFLEAALEYFIDYEKNSNCIKRSFIKWSRRQAQKRNKNKLTGPKTLKFLLAKHLILNKMSARIGLDACRMVFTGGSPARRDIFKFILSMDIPLLEIFGLSECGFVISNTRSKFKDDCVGRVVDGIQVKFQESESCGYTQLCFWGRTIFMGYLDDELKTKEAFDEDSYFVSSDIVAKDADNFIKYCGRSTDLIVRNDGRKVLPFPIERRILSLLPCLDHCVVVGEGKDFLNVLLLFKLKLDHLTGKQTDDLHDSVLDWCQTFSSCARKLSDIVDNKDKKLDKEIQKVIDEANVSATSDSELICKWKIIPGCFTLNKELGQLSKMKRSIIYEIYKKEIDEFYNGK